MARVLATLENVSPYSQSRHYESSRTDDESFDDHYKRTWRQHCHVGRDGICHIPIGALTQVVQEAAKRLAIQIPGKGKERYTKNFDSGILVLEPLSLNVHIDNVEHEALYLNADGRRGGSTRVTKYYPVFHKWGGVVEYEILDETVLQSVADKSLGDITVFEHAIRSGGKFIGIGRFNPLHRGFYGRFQVNKIDVIR